MFPISRNTIIFHPTLVTEKNMTRYLAMDYFFAIFRQVAIFNPANMTTAIGMRCLWFLYEPFDDLPNE